MVVSDWHVSFFLEQQRFSAMRGKFDHAKLLIQLGNFRQHFWWENFRQHFWCILVSHEKVIRTHRFRSENFVF